VSARAPRSCDADDAGAWEDGAGPDRDRHDQEGRHRDRRDREDRHRDGRNRCPAHRRGLRRDGRGYRDARHPWGDRHPPDGADHPDGSRARRGDRPAHRDPPDGCPRNSGGSTQEAAGWACRSANAGSRGAAGWPCRSANGGSEPQGRHRPERDGHPEVKPKGAALPHARPGRKWRGRTVPTAPGARREPTVPRRRAAPVALRPVPEARMAWRPAQGRQAAVVARWPVGALPDAAGSAGAWRAWDGAGRRGRGVGSRRGRAAHWPGGS